MEHHDAPDEFPEPFHRRSTTRVAAIVLGLIAAIAFAWWLDGRTARTLEDMAERGEFDAGWSLYRTRAADEPPCVRHKMAASLARLDPRSDTLLVRLADSLRNCRIPAGYVRELAARGYFRILERAGVRDSEALWRLQANAFRAASDCVAADSLHLECQILGFEALSRMHDTVGQRNWIENALRHAPRDTALLARRARVPGGTPADPTGAPR